MPAPRAYGLWRLPAHHARRLVLRVCLISDGGHCGISDHGDHGGGYDGDNGGGGIGAH